MNLIKSYPDSHNVSNKNKKVLYKMSELIIFKHNLHTHTHNNIHTQRKR